MDFIQAATDAWNRTQFLLASQGSGKRWLNYWLLSILVGGGMGGGFSCDKKIDPENPGTLPNIDPGAILAFVLAVGVVVFVAGIVWMWLGSVARIVLVENVVYNRHSIREPFGRLTGLGNSLFGFGMVASVAILGTGTAFAGAACYTMFPADRGDWPHMLLALCAAFLVGLPFLLAFSLFAMLSDEIIAPLMYRENVGALGAWRMLWTLMTGSPFQWFLWFVVRSGLGTVLALCVAAVCAIVGGATSLLVGVPALILGLAGPQAMALGLASSALVLIPVAAIVNVPMLVFQRCFSIYCMQSLHPTLTMLPAGGLYTLDDVGPAEPVVDPGFSPSVGTGETVDSSGDAGEGWA